MRTRFVGAALTLALALSVNGGAALAQTQDLVVNGGFESGTAPWVESAPHQLITTTRPHTGRYSAQLCATAPCKESLSQTVAVPSGVSGATLTFWIYESSTSCSDTVTVTLVAGHTTFAATTQGCSGFRSGRWTQLSLNASGLKAAAGGSAVLTIAAQTATRGVNAPFFVDDVSLPATLSSTPPPAGTQVSADTFTSTTPGQHHTEVEPDTFAYGNTFVSAFQVGRIYDGGSAAIGWATHNGSSWSNGLLPGITSAAGGSYPRATDAGVAYDAVHGEWLVASLALRENPVSGAAVLVSRSPDGVNWSAPSTVALAGGEDYDKDWIVCDNGASSPYRGHCYVEWDDNAAGDLILMSTSKDGGLTWSAPIVPNGSPYGLGGQPVVQPNGTVIVPAANGDETGIIAFQSTNGGAGWGSVVTIAGVQSHSEANNLRSGPLPTAEIDGAGNVYVVWQDCRFESACSANDLVMSTSANGISWSSVQRIPIDAVGSGVDHFLPGLAVDPATSGGSAHLGLTYYEYPTTNCGSSCSLEVGFISSTTGGSTWSSPQIISSSFSVSWLATTDQGSMVGDYISTSFLNGAPMTVVAEAGAPSGGYLNESMEGIPETLGTSQTPVDLTAPGGVPTPGAPRTSR